MGCRAMQTLFRGRTTAKHAVLAVAVPIFVVGAMMAKSPRMQDPSDAATDQEAPKTAPADLAQACRATADWLSGQLTADDRVVVRPPLVIGGNLTVDELDRVYRDTIAPTVRAIIADYLDGPPSLPTVILLARDEASYHAVAERLFAAKPQSSYGFYRPHLRMVVVNMARGSGGLTHELTHALLACQSPPVPQWFDEGLASLHESSRLCNGVLVGQDNWRLGILQEAIRRGHLLPLEEVIAGDGFREQPIGTSYAQVRYFCLFLQQHELLRESCHLLRRNEGENRESHAMISLFPERNWHQIDQEFRRWVLNRRGGGQEALRDSGHSDFQCATACD